MNLSMLDWSIVIGIMAGLTALAWSLQRYSRNVTDYIAANRCAGRYLLTVGEGAAGVGAITMVAFFQLYYQSGFVGLWWMNMQIATGTILALSGWVVYRLRQTKALTVAQFFELRYSRNFRIFSGILIFVASVLNYGIFPGITAQFVIFFFGLPSKMVNLAGFHLDLTQATVMFCMLGLALLFTSLGGQIVVLITDFIQGSLINIVFISVVGFLVWKIGYHTAAETILAAPRGESLINPFDQSKVPDFNMWYFIMSAMLLMYQRKLWQGTSQGVTNSAKSPHEARMSGILQGWRSQINLLAYLLVPIAAYVVMNSTHYTALAETIQNTVDGLPGKYNQSQMLVPVAMAKLLPSGLFGLVCTVILVAALSTDDTLLLTYGSIFVQDVVAPLRGKPISPEKRLAWIKFSALGVAIFAFLFSLLFPVADYLKMYLQITGSIYMGGAGAVVIGGLYWKRGTTAGAWAGMITGSVLAFSGILTRHIFWPKFLPIAQHWYPSGAWLQSLPADCPMNGMQMGFGAALSAIVAYVLVSMLTKPDPSFDLDRMLHRGKWSEDKRPERSPGTGVKARLWRFLHVGSEFTMADKIIYLASFGWTFFFGLVFLVVTLYGLRNAIPDAFWVKWWIFQISAFAVVAIITTIWFIIGGIGNILEMLRILKVSAHDAHDDGTVVGHHNWSENGGGTP
jgi:SSS family solute:Na+ symporter